VQSIIVDSVTIINPQFASIIRDNAKAVIAGLEEPRAGSPAHSKVITSGKARPSSPCVPVVHKMTPTSHVWLAALQKWASTTLTRVEGILPEEAMSICGAECSRSPAACTCDSPTICRVRSSVPEEHTSVASMLEHFQSHELPPTAKISVRLPITPPVQAIVVDRVPTVNPQLAAVI
jgi:hypothetical protein